jgi:hypothetical protein
MASDRRYALRILITQAMKEADNKSALKRLATADSKLQSAEERVRYLESDKNADEAALAAAEKETREVAETLRALGKEFGMPSLKVVAHA